MTLQEFSPNPGFEGEVFMRKRCKHVTRYALNGIVVLLIATAWSDRAARADLVSYQLMGTASGSLGSGTLTNASFTVTGDADSAEVVQIFPGIFLNPLQDVTVDISGLGTVGAIDAFYFFVNQDIPGAGFIDVATADVVDVDASDYAVYDGTTLFGPIGVTETFLAPFSTTGGLLNFVSMDNLVFQTIEQPVPEPTAFTTLLTVVGFVCIGLVGRFRADN